MPTPKKLSKEKADRVLEVAQQYEDDVSPLTKIKKGKGKLVVPKNYMKPLDRNNGERIKAKRAKKEQMFREFDFEEVQEGYKGTKTQRDK